MNQLSTSLTLNLTGIDKNLLVASGFLHVPDKIRHKLYSDFLLKNASEVATDNWDDNYGTGSEDDDDLSDHEKRRRLRRGDKRKSVPKADNKKEEKNEDKKDNKRNVINISKARKPKDVSNV